jgi:Fur family transcriptional regulator, zinc uptake regulator
MKNPIATTQIQAIIEHAARHCKDRGVRLTDKRKQVLQALISAQKPLSAYEIVELYKENFKLNIPTMSVYRILDFLQEENLVHKLQLFAHILPATINMAYNSF